MSEDKKKKGALKEISYPPRPKGSNLAAAPRFAGNEHVWKGLIKNELKAVDLLEKKLEHGKSSTF